MQTALTPEFAGTAEGIEADAILRKCVHCGFCTATCPTYQLLGDELDGPRGRIYLIKQVLEGHAPTRSTQLHLDRCLTCRNCETTCPSGVQYGNLVEIGRRIVDERVPRPAGEQMLRTALTDRPDLAALQAGAEGRPDGARPAARRAEGEGAAGGAGRARTAGRSASIRARCCCCSAACSRRWRRTSTARPRACSTPPASRRWSPRTPAAAARSTCTAATTTAGSTHMRRNIDAWWPLVSTGGVEAIVMNASGCGVTVKEYGHSLRHDPAYADKANRIADLTRDLSELLPDIVPALAKNAGVASDDSGARGSRFHPPCTLAARPEAARRRRDAPARARLRRSRWR